MRRMLPSSTGRTPGHGVGRRGARVLLGVLAATAALLSVVPAASSWATAAPAAPAALATATARAAGLADPVRNRTLVVPTDGPCRLIGSPSSLTCQQAWVTNINSARTAEHVRPLVLPHTWRTLSPARQVFVLTNLERVDRSLAPVVGLNPTLTARGVLGAAKGVDPSVAGWQLGPLTGRTWTANQATVLNPLQADWLWMYADGWAGSQTSNVDCTSARSAACWGHRHNVLKTFTGLPVLVAGTAAVVYRGMTSCTELVLAGTGRAPQLTYTWAQALEDGADAR